MAMKPRKAMMINQGTASIMKDGAHSTFVAIRVGMIPVAAQSKAWVCGCSLAGTVGSNAARGMDVCLL